MHYKSIWHINDKLSIVLHDVSLQKCFLPVPGKYEIKELEDSPDNQTFASISQRISSVIL
jgi:hypothetical protein